MIENQVQPRKNIHILKKKQMYNQNKYSHLLIYKKIVDNVGQKKWPCMCPACKVNAVNSHLMQNNGILNKIAEKGHLIEVKQNSIYEIEEGNDEYIFRKIGVNKAFSKPLFCNHHDSKIFKPIELSDITINNYAAGLLFSYRALCAELRRKQINLEIESRILNSNSLKYEFSVEERNKIISY